MWWVFIYHKITAQRVANTLALHAGVLLPLVVFCDHNTLKQQTNFE